MSCLPRAEATRFVFVRHAEPDQAMRGRAYGALDVPLSADGRRRTEALAAALEPWPFAAVYSSPLRRAVETARPIALPHGLSPITDERLRELEIGEFEGRSYAEIEANEPHLFSSWMETPTRVRFPGGESFDDLRARVLAATDEMRVRHAGTAIPVVAHAGVTRTILMAALALPEEALFRLDQPYGGVSVIDWVDGVPLVRAVNAIGLV